MDIRVGGVRRVKRKRSENESWHKRPAPLEISQHMFQRSNAVAHASLLASPRTLVQYE